MPTRRVYLETFGCQMNELDSELVAGQLRALGYQFTPDAARADVVLYNTCSVREHAEQKVWSRLGEVALRKRAEPSLVVGVLGCMAERDGTDLIRRMPVVDVMCGPGELDKLPGLLDNAVRTRESLVADDPEHAGVRSARVVALQGNTSRRSATLAAAEDTLELLDLSRAVSPVDVTTDPHADSHADPHADPHAGDRDDADGPRRGGEGGPRSAYVRITRGCNKFCTYCVVPFTRGAEIHRPPEHIIDECKRLADAGVVEITLLGQTVNHYRFEHGSAVTVNGVVQSQKGRSYAGGHRRDPFAGDHVTTFADLLRRIHDEVPSVLRLRFVTSYPRDFGDDVLEVIRDHPRLCRYLHVPAQTGSDRLLKLMNRGYTVGEYEEFLARARHILDEPAKGRPLMLSGDFIVGFPTETDEDFAATTALLDRCRYKNSFIFKYSPRPGTPAHDKLVDDVPEAVKRRRNNELLAAQSRISDEISRAQVGRPFGVIVEGYSRRELRKSMSGSELRRAGQVAVTVGGRAVAPTQEAAATTDNAPVQMSGRTDGDMIVFFDAPPASARSLVGRIVNVRIDAADHLSLRGSMLGAASD